MHPVIGLIFKQDFNTWEREVYNLLSQEGSDDLDTVDHVVRKTLATKQVQNPEGYAKVKEIWNAVRWDAL